MKKGALFTQVFIAGLIMFAVPAGLLYYYDNLRLVQLSTMGKKILWSENEKEVNIVREQIKGKIGKIASDLASLTPSSARSKYAGVIEERTVRNNSYSKSASLEKIKAAFLSAAKGHSATLSLVSMNGRTYTSTDPAAKNEDHAKNPKFIQAKSSRNTAYEINFNAGRTEYFFPVTDVKDRMVSLVYAREDISALADRIRKDKQSEKGYNFIVDESGQVILNTDRQKENSESVIMMPDIKPILSEAGPSDTIAEKSYNNLRGLLGFRKVEQAGLILCVFTPYSDYKFMNKEAKVPASAFLDNSLALPAYGILAIAFILGLLIMAAASGAPYKPIQKINAALTHIDEPGFAEMLPRDKKGSYRKITDAILILKERLKASEEKSEKLSAMSKQLEEELSKEASRADSEISELRNTMKIAESNKASLEDEVIKAKQEAERAKREAEQKLQAEKGLMQVRVTTLEKEIEKLKEEVKKAGESKVPLEKENMRMDSVLMMNTELKGVLSVIKTYISSVLGGEGKITDAQQQFLGVVINKSARLERLINDLTELAKIEKNEIALARAETDVNNTIQDIIFAIQPQADIKKVELKVNFAATLPTAYGDAPKVSNIASQLLNQAIKVSPRGGKVVVETKEDKESVLIAITDFGMSMPQSKTSALFVNFHGPESKAGPEFANTGLRFPIIKAMMRNMGGDIWVESEIGKGKAFVISLPKNAGGSKPAAAPVKAPVQGAAAQKPSEPALKTPAGFSKPEAGPAVAPAAPAPAAGFKIQRGMEGASLGGPSIKVTKEPEAKNPATVSDLLNFDIPLGGRAAPIPGAATQVPPGLIPPKEAAIEPLPELKIEGEKKAAPSLPTELPPLPELEDDKGTDKI
jgi:signal transduction histidine kinase